MGFEINTFKFTVKIPKIKLRKPRILRKRVSLSSSDDSECSVKSGRVTTCVTRFTPKFETNSIKSDQNSVSTDPSFTSDDWIKEFNARCRSVSRLPKPEDIEDVEKNFYANVPSATSTPVSCKILPLNKIVEEDRQIRFLPNVSGIKIYETLDIGSDGNEIIDTSSDESNEHSDDYETVQFKSQQIVPVPKTLFKPKIRTLKSSRR